MIKDWLAIFGAVSLAVDVVGFLILCIDEKRASKFNKDKSDNTSMKGY